MKIHYAVASNNDEGCITTLLRDVNLPADGINIHPGNFITAKADDKIVGVIGLESFGYTGLLRSLAVREVWRRQGIGTELVKRLSAHASRLGIKELYLLTETAENFFIRFGFERVERNDAPNAVKETSEFSKDCPRSSVCMMKRI